MYWLKDVKRPYGVADVNVLRKYKIAVTRSKKKPVGPTTTEVKSVYV